MVTAYDEPGAAHRRRRRASTSSSSATRSPTPSSATRTRCTSTSTSWPTTPPRWRGPGPGCLILGDMPWMSYHLSPDDAVRNAATLIRAGAHAVKLEGGRARLPVVEAIVQAEIPVMGHLGLTPQSVLRHGRLPGPGQERRRRERPCSAPPRRWRRPAASPSSSRACPTSWAPRHRGDRRAHHRHRRRPGLRRPGAGLPRRARARQADAAQIRPPVREVGRIATEAIAAFAGDVRNGNFPSDAESYHAPRASATP